MTLFIRMWDNNCTFHLNTNTWQRSPDPPSPHAILKVIVCYFMPKIYGYATDRHVHRSTMNIIVWGSLTLCLISNKTTRITMATWMTSLTNWQSNWPHIYGHTLCRLRTQASCQVLLSIWSVPFVLIFFPPFFFVPCQVHIMTAKSCFPFDLFHVTTHLSGDNL